MGSAFSELASPDFLFDRLIPAVPFPQPATLSIRGLMPATGTAGRLCSSVVVVLTVAVAWDDSPEVVSAAAAAGFFSSAAIR